LLLLGVEGEIFVEISNYQIQTKLFIKKMIIINLTHGW